jgi:hypothetical protein
MLYEEAYDKVEALHARFDADLKFMSLAVFPTVLVAMLVSKGVLTMEDVENVFDLAARKSQPFVPRREDQISRT